MDDLSSLSHTRWECKYHVVFIPKYRRKVLYGQLRKELGRVLADLARQKECQIVRGSLQPDHVHMEISIPPKYAVSQVIGYIKGKARSGSPAPMAGASGTMWGNTFGRAATSCLPWGRMTCMSDAVEGISRWLIAKRTPYRKVG